MCLIPHSKQHFRIFFSIFALVPTKLAFCYLRGLYCHHLCKELLWFWYSVHRGVRSNPLISLWIQQSKLDCAVVLENCTVFSRFWIPYLYLLLKGCKYLPDFLFLKLEIHDSSENFHSHKWYLSWIACRLFGFFVEIFCTPFLLHIISQVSRFWSIKFCWICFTYN